MATRLPAPRRQPVHPPGQHRPGGTHQPRDRREAVVSVQHGGQLAGSLPLPPGPVSLGHPAAGHQDTSFPVSQPAFSSAARVSSAVR
jgi:hypothetical protein